jgi:hypothetical protein
MCDVSKGGLGGGSAEKRTYDVSHGQNRYVRLPQELQSLDYEKSEGKMAEIDVQ